MFTGKNDERKPELCGFSQLNCFEPIILLNAIESSERQTKRWRAANETFEDKKEVIGHVSPGKQNENILLFKFN